MKQLDGKNIIVTGGTSGIGRAIALRFAREAGTRLNSTERESARPR